MKTLLSTLVLMLVCITTQASNEPSKTITIGGEFLEKKAVKYEVYKIYADSTCEKVYSKVGVEHFDAELEIGESYVIKFTAVNGKVKYLYVDVLGGGSFSIDVDFTNTKSAKLILKPGTYSLQMLSHREAESLAYVPK